MNFAQIKAIEKANKQKILRANPSITEDSGIYILTREEGGFRYAYIGQAKRILTRLAGHLRDYQHIDISLRKHGLYSEANPTGWRIAQILVDVEDLDEAERKYIKQYADAGYQLYNHTTGGQGEGKRELKHTERKGYRAGIAEGYKRAQKDVAHLFKLHLTYRPKRVPPTKIQERALEKFANFLAAGENGGKNDIH